jgi:hypothetical protein
MAEVLISPGVLARENDQSQITAGPVQAGAAIIGPTVKGQQNIPKLVTSYSEYLANFGSTFLSGSNQYTFFTSISAYNYFQNGGSSLLVTRVTPGDFSPATSTTASNNTGIGALVEANILPQVGTNPGDQDDFGPTALAISSTTGNGVNGQVTLTFTGGAGAAECTTATVSTAGTGYKAGDTITFSAADLDAASGIGVPTATDLTFLLVASNVVQSGTAFTLETLSHGNIMNSTGSGVSTGANGTLTSGSSDNFRWEITNPSTSSGVFSLLIRQGNDTATSKQVVETFSNISLDPLATNYISKVIGDQVQTVRGSGTGVYLQSSGSYPNASRYVRVKEVFDQTPNYFDNNGAAKDIYTASIPVAQNGAFELAVGDITGSTIPANFYQAVNNTDSQGLVGANYTTAINLLANRDDFRYNVITSPGLILANGTSGAGWTLIQSNCETRGDAIFVGDLVNYDATITQVTGQAASVDSSYVATYWPWLQVIDPDSRELVWVPASTMIPGVYAYNDRAGEPWFAPAGINRGGLGAVNQAERKLTNTNRDTLYTGKVNPIASFPGQGIVVFGQKTLQTKASALDRVNVRRLLITLKNYISQIADTLVFEQNTAATRNTFLAQVNPYLESVQQRQGLYAFKVVMDNTNNTPDVIDRNELIGAVYLQPTKTAEFIYLDFNILPTGATFPA